MKWYRNLFLGNCGNCDIEEIKHEIINRINHNHFYLITLPANDENLLDIITAEMGALITWREVYVIGIAGSKDDAVSLTVKIIETINNEIGSFDFREYFNEFD